MPEDYFRGDADVSLNKESVLRDLDAKITAPIAIDMIADDELMIAEPYLKSEEHYPIGGGENVGKISYHGYDPSEESLPMYIQTGIMLYYALGQCVTTGSHLATGFTDVIANVAGSVVTMTTNTSMTPDEHIGSQIQVTVGDEEGTFYTITDNDGTTLTLDSAPSADMLGDTIILREPWTDTVNGVAGSVITMTTHGAMTPDAYIGKVVEITVGDEVGELYLVTTNSATELTLNHAPSADLDGDTIKLTEAPFTHAITESRNRPTWGLHIEQRNNTPAQNIIIDLIGIITKGLSMTFEKDGDGMWEVAPQIAKAITSDALGGSLPSNYTDPIKNWTMVETSTLTYNSADVITKADQDSILLEITNNSNLLAMIGDEWAQKHQKGTREYLWKYHIFPQNRVLYNLRNTKIQNYLTDLAYTFKCKYTGVNYIQLTYDKLRLTEYPNKIPSKDDNIVGLDIELRIAPLCAVACEVMDDRSFMYYEKY